MRCVDALDSVATGAPGHLDSSVKLVLSHSRLVPGACAESAFATSTRPDRAFAAH